MAVIINIYEYSLSFEVPSDLSALADPFSNFFLHFKKEEGSDRYQHSQEVS
jgi:hypothetical protein